MDSTTSPPSPPDSNTTPFNPSMIATQMPSSAGPGYTPYPCNSKKSNWRPAGPSCRSCRDMKVKCDRARPYCGACQRACREDGCQYDDGVHRSRHQILEDRLQELQAQVAQLENTPPSSPQSSIGSSISSPTQSWRSSRSPDTSLGSSRAGSFSSFETRMSGSVHPHRSAMPSMRTGSIPPPRSLSSVYPSLDSPLHPAFWEQLKQTFLHHLTQLTPITGLSNTFESHSLVLRTAGYLLGADFQRASPFIEKLIPSATQALNQALTGPEDTVDVIKTCYLLALHSYINGNVLEGMYHAAAAVSLCLQCRLHQIDWPEDDREGVATGTSRSHELWSHPTVGTPVLPPAPTQSERERRIRVFWQVFYMDRCWSVALGTSVLFTNGNSSNQMANLDMEITTPWPGQGFEEVVPGRLADTITRLCSAADEPVPNNIEALLAQAAALFRRASVLSLEATTISPGTVLPDEYWIRYSALERALELFASRLPSISSVSSKEADTRLVSAHTFLHATSINLFSPFVSMDENTRGRSLTEARAVLEIIRSLEPRQYDILDPLMGTLWLSTAGVFINEMAAVQKSASFYDLESLDILNAEYQIVLDAMQKLGRIFPIVDTLRQRAVQYHQSSSPAMQQDWSQLMNLES
ncbi:hypothetical protein SISNIDRAFT_486840 [Sistotremastrum niveocremeum HHB9708]|uniref:Zn(2)-C6 fungal-type domain-containing protein n=1 Tax=Sistotremastrum niveocremeum HHB9708 TaxID=1314777 RepID=A0A164TF06_9AGAM|nr:hypothetical protein SISNIDRAFT_486840 [Sistotremastrum niveocremeum HHB9708]